MASERADTQESRARQSTFPLNSKRLTVAYLTQLAAALQLPTKASATDLLQIIEGKLREMEYEPQNVQVVVKEADVGESAHLQLQDVKGVFLEAAPVHREDEEVADNTGTEGAGDMEAQRQVDTAQEEDDSIEELREALLVTRRERDELDAALTVCKERLSEVWSANCAQLRQFDSLMGSAEEEIKSLKQQLAEAQRAANNCSPASSVSTVSSPHTVSPTPATGLTTKRSGKRLPLSGSPMTPMKYSSMTGYLLLNELLSGMDGLGQISYFNWQVTSKGKRCRNGC